MNEREKLFEDHRIFYQKCAELLCVEHVYKKPYSHRTRWNNRNPGNGRFAGFGLIRVYAPDMIHVCLTNPVALSKTFDTMEEVLLFLKNLLT